MRVGIVALDLRVGAVSQQSFDHRGDLGRRTGFELGTDVQLAALGMPVDYWLSFGRNPHLTWVGSDPWGRVRINLWGLDRGYVGQLCVVQVASAPAADWRVFFLPRVSSGSFPSGLASFFTANPAWRPLAAWLVS